MKIMGKGIKNVKRIKLHWGMSIQLQIVPQQTIKIGLKIKESEEFSKTAAQTTMKPWFSSFFSIFLAYFYTTK